MKKPLAQYLSVVRRTVVRKKEGRWVRDHADPRPPGAASHVPAHAARPLTWRECVHAAGLVVMLKNTYGIVDDTC